MDIMFIMVKIYTHTATPLTDLSLLTLQKCEGMWLSQKSRDERQSDFIRGSARGMKHSESDRM